jgi:hypothetical protein
MHALGTGLLVLAYLLAVVDGARQPTGLYPSEPGGRIGLTNFARAHPWIVAGAASGAAGTIINLIS